MPIDQSRSHVSRGEFSRREFLHAGGVAATAFTIVPRHVLGGAGYVAPSDKVTLACIGIGTQAIREIGSALSDPRVRVVAVCDVEKDGVNYLEWEKGGIRNVVRRLLQNPTWREGQDHTPGGRDVGKEMVDTFYAQQGDTESSRGCATYTDFRELLDRERDVTAVKIMTPDHTHGCIAVAALTLGKNVVMHKPIANRLVEARKVIDTARAQNVATHFLPAGDGARIHSALAMVEQGAIGTLREIHNWSSRPMWPQFDTLPADAPPVPNGFDWTLWLGPSLDRPYHPNYTHTNFRGWYEFGGGSIADMGHYSLWSIFQHLNLDAPILVESTPSHVSTASNGVCRRIKNDYSFPAACTVRMRFAAKGDRPALDIFWYDGGIRPRTPDELFADDAEFPEEGMMFVGDDGKILAGFWGENPQLVPKAEMKAYLADHGSADAGDDDSEQVYYDTRTAAWVDAFSGGPASYGDFTLAGPITDAVNLAAVSLRLGGQRLLFDSASATTNVSEANGLLTRAYRPGWEF